jgi:hypothetical protein
MMTLQDLGSIGEVIGALAVVVSLFYVGFQIRQNTSAVRSATAQAVHDNYASWYTTIATDPDLMKISIDGMRDYRSLSETEKGRFIATFMAFLSFSQNAFYQWRAGSLSPQLWVGWELLIVLLVRSPGGEEFWKERGYIWGGEFRDYIESVIMKRPIHPEARPLGAFKIG